MDDPFELYAASDILARARGYQAPPDGDISRSLSRG
jgi:hypothetical protein